MSYTAHVAGKLYRDFSPWVESFGENFCEQLADAYGPACLSDRLASELSYYHHIRSFLDYFAEADCAAPLRRWLAENFGKVSTVTKEVRAHYNILLASYRKHVDELDLTRPTKNNKISGVQWLLRIGENAGLFPAGLAITGFRVGSKVGRGSTFLDVNMVGEVDLASLMTNAEKILGEDYLFDCDTQQELRTLLENLLLEVSQIDREEFDPYSCALMVLEDRITSLRKKCAEIIVKHMNLSREARDWAQSEFYIERARQLHSAFQSYSGDPHQQSKIYREILDDHPLEILTVYAFQYFGRYPLSTEDFYNTWSQRVHAYGISTHELRQRLGAATNFHAACHAFICFEVAGNPDSITNLRVDSLTHETGVYSLHWHKYRRGSQSLEKVAVRGRDKQYMGIINADNLTVVDVFDHLKLITAPLRPDAHPDEKEKLFLSHYKNGSSRYGYMPKGLHAATLNRHFKYICQEVSGGAWESTLKAIRGSLLLFEGMLTGDATQVAIKGRHSSLSMASKYTYHIPEILRRELNIRKFLDWFETLLTLDIEDFANKVGIDPDAYDKRAQEIINSQFGGIHCSNPKAGIQPGTEVGEVCHRVDKCVGCENRRDIFVMSESNLVSLLHWNAVLEEAEKTLSTTEFKKWALWRLFTSSMLERIESQDQHARLLEDACEAQRSMKNPYRGVIPTLDVTAGEVV